MASYLPKFIGNAACGITNATRSDRGWGSQNGLLKRNRSDRVGYGGFVTVRCSLTLGVMGLCGATLTTN